MLQILIVLVFIACPLTVTVGTRNLRWLKVQVADEVYFTCQQITKSHLYSFIQLC